jgi:hypothetical protein
MDALIPWLDRWQALVAGVVGAAALILTVVVTLLAERRQEHCGSEPRSHDSH